jgi:glycosyltransferase involved in cell wall biosynthesis
VTEPTVEVWNGTGILQVCEGQVLRPNAWTRVPLSVGRHYFNRPQFEVKLEPDLYPWKEADGLHLGWQSPINYLDGYGSTAEDMIAALLSLEVRLHIYPAYTDQIAISSPVVRETLQNQSRRIPPAAGISYTTPGTFQFLPTPFKVGLTMYESTDPTAIPHQRNWPQQINEVDLLLTPGEWLVEVWQGLGVHTPIKVIELPGGAHFYEAEPWSPPDGPFRVITWAIMRDRKSPVETIEVFEQAFPRTIYPDCRLIIKTRDGWCGGPQRWKPHVTDDRIQIIDADYTPAQMVELARQCHVCLYLSRGEGSGRTPREALGLGLPLICADNTSMVTCCDPRYMTPVPTKAWEPASIGGRWAVPDWDWAVYALRDVHDHYSLAAEKARKGRPWAVERFSPRACAQGILQALEDVEPEIASHLQRLAHRAKRQAASPGPGPRGMLLKVLAGGD